MKQKFPACILITLLFGGSVLSCGCQSAPRGGDSANPWQRPFVLLPSAKRGDEIASPAKKANPNDTSRLAHDRAEGRNPTSALPHDNSLRPDSTEMARLSQVERNDSYAWASEPAAVAGRDTLGNPPNYEYARTPETPTYPPVNPYQNPNSEFPNLIAQDPPYVSPNYGDGGLPDIIPGGGLSETHALPTGIADSGMYDSPGLPSMLGDPSPMSDMRYDPSVVQTNSQMGTRPEVNRADTEFPNLLPRPEPPAADPMSLGSAAPIPPAPVSPAIPYREPEFQDEPTVLFSPGSIGNNYPNRPGR